eukprot:758893-Hanusia_phi.AAC.3
MSDTSSKTSGSSGTSARRAGGQIHLGRRASSLAMDDLSVSIQASFTPPGDQTSERTHRDEETMTMVADTASLQYWLKLGPILCAIVGVGIQIIVFVVGIFNKGKVVVASVLHELPKKEEDHEPVVDSVKPKAEEAEDEELAALRQMHVSSRLKTCGCSDA